MTCHIIVKYRSLLQYGYTQIYEILLTLSKIIIYINLYKKDKAHTNNVGTLTLNIQNTNIYQRDVESSYINSVL